MKISPNLSRMHLNMQGVWDEPKAADYFFTLKLRTMHASHHESAGKGWLILDTHSCSRWPEIWRWKNTRREISTCSWSLFNEVCFMNKSTAKHVAVAHLGFSMLGRPIFWIRPNWCKPRRLFFTEITNAGMLVRWWTGNTRFSVSRRLFTARPVLSAGVVALLCSGMIRVLFW